VGVVHALDMTTEATCAKLAYLFGKGVPNTKVRLLPGTPTQVLSDV
jgi:hypothetical protein